MPVSEKSSLEGGRKQRRSTDGGEDVFFGLRGRGRRCGCAELEVVSCRDLKVSKSTESQRGQRNQTKTITSYFYHALVSILRGFANISMYVSYSLKTHQNDAAAAAAAVVGSYYHCCILCSAHDRDRTQALCLKANVSTLHPRVLFGRILHKIKILVFSCPKKRMQ